MINVNPASLALAAVAGALSFASPCVLPLVPAYLGYITGERLDVSSAGRQRGAILGHTMAFIVGLAVVFTLLGATASAFGRGFIQFQPLWTKLGGVIVVVLGLHVLGVIRISWLAQQRSLDPARYRGRGMLGAGLMGAAFATGWVPCVGPFLAGILALASQEATVTDGMVLLFVYALGLGVPFLLLGLLWGRASGWVAAMRPSMPLLESVGGLLLVTVGILLFTDQYTALTVWATSTFGTGLTL